MRTLAPPSPASRASPTSSPRSRRPRRSSPGASTTGYPPEAIGAGFRTGHAYASLVGPGGPFTAGDFDLGLFLIAPQVFYRDHRHAAPELYAPLTGPHGWRFAPGDPLDWQPAHTPVWNPPQRPHATKVGAVPFLCLYAWTSDVAEPAVIVEADDWPRLDR